MARKLKTNRFPPHVTLAAGFRAATTQSAIEATRGVAALPEFAKPLECVFERRRSGEGEGEAVSDSVRVDAGESFFQSVYAVVRKTSELNAAHDAAKQMLGERGMHVATPNPVYFPHLSLVYGDLEQLTRDAAAKELGLALTGSAVDPGFTFSELQLWRTELGDTAMESWEQILAIELT